MKLHTLFNQYIYRIHLYIRTHLPCVLCISPYMRGRKLINLQWKYLHVRTDIYEISPIKLIAKNTVMINTKNQISLTLCLLNLIPVISIISTDPPQNWRPSIHWKSDINIFFSDWWTEYKGCCPQQLLPYLWSRWEEIVFFLDFHFSLGLTNISFLVATFSLSSLHILIQPLHLSVSMDFIFIFA